MHLAKPCCEPVMETSSPQQDARQHHAEEGDAVAERVGVFAVHPTHRLGVPSGSHAGWLKRSAHSSSLAYRLSSAASIGLNAPSTASPPWEGRHDDGPSNDARTATDGGDAQMFGADKEDRSRGQSD